MPTDPTGSSARPRGRLGQDCAPGAPRRAKARLRFRVPFVGAKGLAMRPILPEERIDPAIRERVENHHRDIVREVEAAIASNEVVVVGMAQNPFPKKAKRALDDAGVPHRYLEYGSYLGMWRRRNALKMWSGWPTFPMVFVRGVLIGGADELQRMIEGGELAAARR